MPLCMWPIGRMYLLKSPTHISLCVGWFLIRILIWSLIIWMTERSVGCEDIYRFTMSSSMSGLLDILNTCKYNDMFLGA